MIEFKKHQIYRVIHENIKFLFLLMIILILSLSYIPLFILTSFMILDFANSYFKNIYGIKLPVDFSLIGIIVLSYNFQIKYALALPLFIILKKFVLGGLKQVHLKKIPIFVFISLLIYTFNIFNFIIVGILTIILRYLIELFINLFILRDMDLKRISQMIYHAISNIILFLFITNLFF